MMFVKNVEFLKEELDKTNLLLKFFAVVLIIIGVVIIA